MNEIQMIPVRKIWGNPNNPRKDMGDLTELVSSIRANGVLQNLTVVPKIGEITGKWDGESYMVVIGHRRLAAARKAGLDEVPCEVRDMGFAEQVQTMLVENMERKGLTTYEEAQGFQMMLDLGSTVEEVAEVSGFSVTTVRNRRKLLDLNPETFKETADRGATLADYMKLDQIESPERKNEVLKEIGTANFDMKLRTAIREEKEEKELAEKIEKIAQFATQVPEEDRPNYLSVRTYYSFDKADSITPPEDASEVAYYFCVGKWNYIYLLKDKTAEEDIDETARQEAQRRAEAENARKEALTALVKEAYELRASFVSQVSAATVRKHWADIVGTWAYMEVHDHTKWTDDEDILSLFGITIPDEEGDEDDDAATLDALISSAEAPEKLMFQMFYLRTDDCSTYGYWRRYNGKYRENEGLDAIYALLEKMGYQMSDVEKALRDGSHALFGTEGAK